MARKLSEEIPSVGETTPAPANTAGDNIVRAVLAVLLLWGAGIYFFGFAGLIIPALAATGLIIASLVFITRGGL